MPKRRRITPKRGKTKSKRVRRRKRVTRRRYGRKSRIPRGLPAKITTTLRYVAEVSIPNTSNTVVGGGPFYQRGHPFIFSLNNIYDPNYTDSIWSLGDYDHQPRGHDQLQAIYNKYCVIGAKVTVKPLFLNPANNDSTTISRDLTMYITIDDDTDTHVEEFSKHEMVEGNTMNHKKIKMVQPFLSNRLGGGGRMAGIRQTASKLSWSAKKFFGNPAKLYRAHMPGRGEDLEPTPFEADYGTAPDQQAFLKIWCNNGFDDATPGYDALGNGNMQYCTIQAQVTIDYLVASHTMKELTKS